MRLLERFNRWRASRGYGVHSPLAFRIVKNVVKPHRDVAYYGEEKLDFFAIDGKPASEKQRRRARLLLRFVAELQPAYVWMSPRLPEIYREAISNAGCVVRLFDGNVYPEELSNSDMVVVDGLRLTRKDLQKALKPGKSLIGFDIKPGMKQSVTDVLKGGVAIDAEDSVIAVSTADEAVHCYKVSRF